MYRCNICRFVVELDDVEIRGIHDNCVCLRCYARIVQHEKPMSKELRRELVSFMAQVA